MWWVLAVDLAALLIGVAVVAQLVRIVVFGKGVRTARAFRDLGARLGAASPNVQIGATQRANRSAVDPER